MSLDRFIAAQDEVVGGFATALDELRRGRKRSHWIWYIFPQLAALGRSSTARFYGLAGLSEASDYLREPTLRTRLVAVTAAVAAQLRTGQSLADLMGSEIDALKLVSSLTLFAAAAQPIAAQEPAVAGFFEDAEEVLGAAAAQGYPRCPLTLAAIGRA